MSSFAAGDRVAWHHAFATQHAEGSIARADAVPQLPDGHPDEGAAGSGQFGTVQGDANEAGTWISVLLDGEAEPRVLTFEEIVKVADA